MAVAMERPWLIPIIYFIHGSGGLDLSMLKSITGLRARVIRRAVWWLRKYGLVEDSAGKLIVKPVFRGVLDEFFLNYCRSGNRHAYRLGGTYYVVAVSSSRITSYTVPAELLERLLEYESNIQAEFTARDLAEALGIPLRLAGRIVGLRRLLRECRGL